MSMMVSLEESYEKVLVNIPAKKSLVGKVITKSILASGSGMKEAARRDSVGIGMVMPLLVNG